MSYVHGDWNAICDRCGFEFKASKLREEWNGLMVCSQCWEPRHPQDFLRGVPDDPSVPWTRPDTDADTSATDVAGNSISTVNSITLLDDETYSYVYGTDHPIVEYYTEVTGARTFGISNTGTEKNGNRVIVYRTAGGAGTVTVNAIEGGGLKIIPANVNARVTVEYNGSLWRLIDYTTLGL